LEKDVGSNRIRVGLPLIDLAVLRETRFAFYDRLNELLAEIEFDCNPEEAAEPSCEKTGRKGLPLVINYWMFFTG
jgi:hypothetical protein